MPLHKDLTLANMHVLHAFEFADAPTMRAAAMTLADVGKIARVAADASFWQLIDHFAPTTWFPVSPPFEFVSGNLAVTGLTAAVNTPFLAHIFGGNLVALKVRAAAGVSNALTMTLTGLPASLIPNLAMVSVIAAQDNGVQIIGSAALLSSGTIQLYAGGTNAPWTAAGAKGFSSFELVYPLVS